MAAVSPGEETPSGNLQVVCRVRPIFTKEFSTKGFQTVVEADTSQGSIRVDGGSYYNKERCFNLHKVFGTDATQSELFDASVSPLVDDVLLGYNVCVFAYGQTGSGKTYTMEGNIAPVVLPQSRHEAPTRSASTSKRRNTPPPRRNTVNIDSGPELFSASSSNAPFRRATSQVFGEEIQQIAENLAKQNGADGLTRSMSNPAIKQVKNPSTPTAPTTCLESESASSDDETLPSDADATVAETHGFIQRSIHALFERLEARHSNRYEVTLSHLELYNEEMYDLFVATKDSCCDRRGSRMAFGSAVHSSRSGNLRLEEDAHGRVRCSGLSEVSITNPADAIALVRRSARARATKATFLNERSSRSHSILSLNIVVKNGIDERGMSVERYGQIYLVDLAGSECLKRSGVQGSAARESATINQSLLTLGRVITALVSKQPHIPYRDSKLTRLLQDSLGGSSKTLIVATVSPLKSNLDETVSTLQYAVNAARIVNAPKRNMRTSVNDKIMSLTQENQRLRELLLATQEKNGEIIPKGMLQSMETELADLREHVGLMHERLQIAQERCDVLKKRLEEKDCELEANGRKHLEVSQTQTRNFERLAEELDMERAKGKELTEEQAQCDKERSALETKVDNLAACDSQLYNELQKDYEDLLNDGVMLDNIGIDPSTDRIKNSSSGACAALVVTRALKADLSQQTESAAQTKCKLNDTEERVAVLEAAEMTLRQNLQDSEQSVLEEQAAFEESQIAAEEITSGIIERCHAELCARDSEAAEASAAARSEITAQLSAEAAIARQCGELAKHAAQEASMAKQFRIDLLAKSEEAEHLLVCDSQLHDELQEDFYDLLQGISSSDIGSPLARQRARSAPGAFAALVVSRDLQDQLTNRKEELAHLQCKLRDVEATAAQREAASQQMLLLEEQTFEEAHALVEARYGSAEEALDGNRAELKAQEEKSAEESAAFQTELTTHLAAEAAISNRCNELSTHAAQETRLAQSFRSEMRAQREVSERESSKLERTISSAMAEFSLRLAAAAAEPAWPSDELGVELESTSSLSTTCGKSSTSSR